MVKKNKKKHGAQRTLNRGVSKLFHKEITFELWHSFERGAHSEVPRLKVNVAFSSKFYFFWIQIYTTNIVTNDKLNKWKNKVH